MRLSFFLLALGVLLVPGGEEPGGVVPNDPYFKYQFSFLNPGGTLAIPEVSNHESLKKYPASKGIDLDVTRAWAITTGSKDVVVAILDNGFFYGHEDVRENLWRNRGETGDDARGYAKETNGIDDDGNGYVDDVMGWDFVFDDADPDHYVFDGMDRSRIQPHWHSMCAMGIIGAKGNNGIGVAGINWDVSLMLLKIGAEGRERGEGDPGQVDRVVEAIRYAVDNGARVINWSGFVQHERRPEKIKALRQAIEYAASKGVLVVVAAGNGMKDLDRAENCATEVGADKVYPPQCFQSENLVLVAEIDFNGELDRFSGKDRVSGSNYGAHRVHIAAVARNFTTSLRHNLSTYGIGGGTSCSAPVVTGVAALVLSVNPRLTARELKNVLMESATRLASLEGKVQSGGMVNAYLAVQLAATQ